MSSADEDFNIWGKLLICIGAVIGAVIGFLQAGIAGAVFGLFIGAVIGICVYGLSEVIFVGLSFVLWIVLFAGFIWLIVKLWDIGKP